VIGIRDMGSDLDAGSELGTIGTAASAIGADQMVYAAKSLREVWAGNQKLSATPETIRARKAGAVVAGVVTKDMANLGVGILAGCDAMLAGFCVHDQLVAMVRGGMTNNRSGMPNDKIAARAVSRPVEGPPVSFPDSRSLLFGSHLATRTKPLARRPTGSRVTRSRIGCVVTGGVCDQATAMPARRAGASRLRRDHHPQLRPDR
jgi:hypothetical protein